MNSETGQYRSRNTILRICAEIVLLAVAFVTAFFVRLDLSFDMLWFKRMIVHLPVIVAAEYLSLVFTRATKGAWRFVSLSDVYRIVLAIFVAHIPFFIERIVFGALSDDVSWTQHFVLPWGALCINLCFSILGCVGIRVVHRMRYEYSQKQNHVLPSGTGDAERTIVMGTGPGCKMILESVRLHPELGIDVVGLVSDELMADGERVFGFPVLGRIDDLGRIVGKHQVSQAIISQTDADSGVLNRILDSLSEVSIKTRIVPRLDDILSGALDIGNMREISVEDLLHRDPVQLDKDKISQFLSKRRILVSGAGGSIGSEVCRQVLAFEPAELVLLERCELFLYEIERELNQIKTDKTRIIPRLADICDESRIREIFEECKPEVIFHAAAYKHVPMLEYNPGEAIRNNVEGTACIANCAVECGSDAFVMISTDKAVNPTSIMGTSKRIAELYIQAMSSLGKTRFCAVRFGNVLGSTGSVLPLFKAQIHAGGPLTVTHPDMVRYFMTIPEASQLVMQAATMGRNGEIFVLDMGKPVKIVDLARDLIRLSGKTEKDIPIVFSGVRPGEKLFEELGFNEEHMDRTGHPKIYVGKLQKVELNEISEAIERLKPYRDSQDNAAVRAAMHEIVPEMMEPESNE